MLWLTFSMDDNWSVRNVAKVKSQDLVLYRFFDDDDRLLYIGKSIQVWGRFVAHKRTSDFYPAAAKITLQRGFDSHDHLLEAEKTAIRGEQPKYNEVYKNPPSWERDPITGCFCGSDSLRDGSCCRRHATPARDFDIVADFVRGFRFAAES